ncbi:MAG: hypothetical protein EOS36_09320 [Mesorhizobium sp.]|nr:MAG: hypothetical protein EOS36_09320 [Mesorhizobium sp.]RWE38280.1 MAG: hypothetical protein EOS79_23715 [Mesorhizobium sp.]
MPGREAGTPSRDDRRHPGFWLSSWMLRAIPGKVCNGFPSGIAQKQILRAVRRFYESLKRSRNGRPCSASRQAEPVRRLAGRCFRSVACAGLRHHLNDARLPLSQLCSRRCLRGNFHPSRQCWRSPTSSRCIVQAEPKTGI